MATLDIADSGRTRWAVLEFQSVHGLGRLNPRLQVGFTARPLANCKVKVDELTLRIDFGQELLGEGRVLNEDVSFDPAHIMFEVPIQPRLLRYVTDSIGPRASAVQLTAQLSGMGQYWMDPATAQRPPVMVNDPELGKWTPFVVSSGGSPASIQVPRTEWYERVLAPTRNEQYQYLEIALPRNDAVLGVEWASAVGHLQHAEKAYVAGDDAAVFVHLRGALDALPGAKQDILGAIGDDRKRRSLDAVLTKAGEFLHSGRHVAADGGQVGSFPVDHVDAAFALDLMRVLLSHLSLMLSAERDRTAR
jgi:hypothetical protein